MRAMTLTSLLVPVLLSFPPVVPLSSGKEGLSQFPTKLLVSVCFLALFTLSTVINMFTGNWATEHLSIHSRSLSGLAGLVFAPFLHPSPSSTFIDCAPFFLLSMLVMLRPKGIQTFAVLVITNAVLGGMVVWFLGRSETNHVSGGRGASEAARCNDWRRND